MWFSALIIGSFIFFTAVILPWINRSHIRETEAQLTAIKKQLQAPVCISRKNGRESAA